MADFSTHLVGATATASLSATVLAKVLGLPADESVMLVCAGVLGGVLPDIDLQQSTPARMLFSTLGAIAAVFWIFSQLDAYSALVLWGGGIAVFCAVRWPVAALFGALTTHRGAAHSLLACATTLLVVSSCSYQWLDASALHAWLLGFFTALGYLVHLVLDELWSVDFAGVRIKRSFGTALKPIDTQRWAGSVLLLMLSLAASLQLPPTTEIRQAAGDVYSALAQFQPGIILPR